MASGNPQLTLPSISLNVLTWNIGTNADFIKMGKFDTKTTKYALVIIALISAGILGGGFIPQALGDKAIWALVGTGGGILAIEGIGLLLWKLKYETKKVSFLRSELLEEVGVQNMFAQAHVICLQDCEFDRPTLDGIFKKHDIVAQADHSFILIDSRQLRSWTSTASKIDSETTSVKLIHNDSDKVVAMISCNLSKYLSADKIPNGQRAMDAQKGNVAMAGVIASLASMNSDDSVTPIQIICGTFDSEVAKASSLHLSSSAPYWGTYFGALFDQAEPTCLGPTQAKGQRISVNIDHIAVKSELYPQHQLDRHLALQKKPLMPNVGFTPIHLPDILGITENHRQNPSNHRPVFHQIDIVTKPDQ